MILKKGNVTIRDLFDFLGVQMPAFLESKKETLIGRVVDHINDVKEKDILFLDGFYATSEAEKNRVAKIAMDRGALAVVSDITLDIDHVLVENPLELYVKVLSGYRKGYSVKTVGITGSIGKTTATEIIYHVINSKFNTLTNGSSANNYRLAGLTVQRLEQKHDAYVQEVMEGPPYGSAEGIGRFVIPDISVITLVSDAHIEHFKTRERIAESCFGITKSMDENGLVLINGDDPYQTEFSGKQRTIRYGLNAEDVDIKAENIQLENEYMHFDIVHGKKVLHAKLRTVGKHNIYYALAAYIIGLEFKMTDNEILEGISSYKPKGIRQNVVKYGNKYLYIDCYNCSTDSMASSVKTLDEMKPNEDGRRVIVFGDIKETGDNAQLSHEKVGKTLKESKAEIVFCFGENAKIAADVCAKDKKKQVYHFYNRDELDRAIKENVKDHDIILFKASHGMQLEQTIDHVFGTHFRDEYDLYENNVKYRDDGIYKYRVNGDNAIIRGNHISKKCEVIHCPDYVDNKPVVGIGVEAFSGNKNFEEVILPKHLRSVRFAAFYCSGLKKVVLPSEVQILERSAFNCSFGLSEVELNDGLVEIGERAFYKCRKLKSLRIPASVQTIGAEAFTGIRNLVIECEKGSFAHAYAKEHGIETVLYDESGKRYDKTTILLLFGGASSEHDVSRKSACSVLSNLDYDKYKVLKIGITREGKWTLTYAGTDDILSGAWESDSSNRPVVLLKDNDKNLLGILNDGNYSTTEFDCIWPVLHGKNGEDGTVQGLCELNGYKFVGPDTCSSALCMDKAFTKMIVSHTNVQQADYLIFNKVDFHEDPKQVIKETANYFKKYPIFVKPARAGSSVGISKVNGKDEIEQAIITAFNEDSKIVIEEGIIGKEIEVAVLGNEKPMASRVGQILPEETWYDYDSKYNSTVSKTLIPADISAKAEEAVRQAAIDIYTTLGCSGLSRVDFFITDEDKIIFNEVNTLPGFTEISMYPKLWDATGISYSELLDKIIEYALER